MGPLPHGVTLHAGLRGTTPFDVVLLFARSRTQLERRFAAAASRILPEGGLWIAWPKRASGVASDLTDEIVRVLGPRRCSLNSQLSTAAPPLDVRGQQFGCGGAAPRPMCGGVAPDPVGCRAVWRF